MSARLRLASLWLSQVARVLGEWCLRLVAVLEGAALLRSGQLHAWHLATALFIAPFLLLAPLNGCVSNDLPRRAVLVGSSAFALLALLGFTLTGGPWLACLGVVALASAVNSPARYAILPAAAADTHLPLPRVNGWMEMGSAASIVGGAALGYSLTDPGWPANGTALAPRVVAVLLGLALVSFLFALPVRFPSDVRRPEPPLQAIAGFFRDIQRIGRERDATGYLLGMASLQALVTAGSGAVVALALAANGGGALQALVLVGVGAALGCALASLQGHPHRCLGLVPYGAAGLVLALGWAMFTVETGSVPPVPCVLLGLMSGLVNVPLRAAYLAAVPADARGNGMAVMNAGIYVMTILLAGALIGLVEVGALPTPVAQLVVLAALAAGGAALAWRLLLMPALEIVLELGMMPMYRVRAHGPGADVLPERGPLVIIANHTAYFDPFWLGKVVPRRLTPMMSSVFYDKPVVSWLMRQFGVIRVQVGKFRREAPELHEAVAALRRGQCVLIFPEAILRRKEEQILRAFGQGAWHILREMPDVPVVVCWIEGGWGSYASYRNGSPMKGKRLDRGRPIDIAFAKPAPLPAEVLADQRATRAYLMRACLECRRYLGLEVPPAPGEEPPEDEV